MKIASLIKELQRAFDVLNAHLFAGNLKMPDFVFIPKKKVVLRYMPDTTQMVLGGDMGVVDVQDFLVHLLHEMVHVSNFSKGVIDCRSNQYHNKEFMQAAVEVGLICVRHRNQGWVTTTSYKGDNAVTPSSEAVERRVAAFAAVNFDKDVLKQAKSQLTQLTKRRRQAIYFLKYECQCPPPHNSIRSGRRPDGDHPLNIKCLECNAKFECVETVGHLPQGKPCGLGG
jgi:hypothetical protein